MALPELSEDERNLVTAFLAHCGVEEKEGVLTVSQNAGSGSWVAPSAQWAMAYALGAFFKPNLHLANHLLEQLLLFHYLSLYLIQYHQGLELIIV